MLSGRTDPAVLYPGGEGEPAVMSQRKALRRCDYAVPRTRHDVVPRTHGEPAPRWYCGTSSVP